MIILDATDEILELLTSAAGSIDVYVAYADITTTAFTPGAQETNITTATTTTVLAAPAASTQRQVKHISIRNRSTTASCAVTVKFDKAATEKYLTSEIALFPGESATMTGDGGWQMFDISGNLKVTREAYYATTRRISSFYKTGTAAEATGRWYCWSKDAGWPGAWDPGTPGINGRATDGTAAADAGCIPYTNATAKNYLSRFTLTATVAAFIMAIDVLWVNSGIVVTTTTAQAITTPAWPARDSNGTANGADVQVGMLITATMGNAAISNTTLDYTNQSGTAGRTATINAGSSTLVVGTIVPFMLQAGDTGIRSIQGITLGTSYVSGTMSLIAFRVVGASNIQQANETSAELALAYPGTPLFNGTCILFASIASATTLSTIGGVVQIDDR